MLRLNMNPSSRSPLGNLLGQAKSLAGGATQSQQGLLLNPNLQRAAQQQFQQHKLLADLELKRQKQNVDTNKALSQISLNSSKLTTEELKQEKTKFDTLSGESKFFMNQLLQLTPTLLSMDEQTFQAKMPVFVQLLRKTNPVFAEMLSADGLSKQDIVDFEQGMLDLKSRIQGRKETTKFSLKNVQLPDGQIVIGRVNDSTGDVFVPSPEGGFAEAPFGSIFASKAGEGNKVEVNVDTGNKLSSGSRKETEVNLMNLLKQIKTLNKLADNFDTDFLTFGGRLKGAGLKFLEKVGGEDVLSDEGKSFLAKQSVFLGRVDRFLAAYVKSVSGAQVTDKEYKRLAAALINGTMSPTEFKARLKDLLKQAIDDIQTEAEFLDFGVPKSQAKQSLLLGAQNVLSDPDPASAAAIAGLEAFIGRQDGSPTNAIQNEAQGALDGLNQGGAQAQQPQEPSIEERQQTFNASLEANVNRFMQKFGREPSQSELERMSKALQQRLGF